MTKSILCKFVQTLRHFRSASCGNISVMFALSLVPITGAVGAAVDYSQTSSIRAAMQAAASKPQPR
jgi:Flp pilus assembly protein TadG